MKKALAVLVLLAVLGGCRAYSWKSSVPEAYRSVAVPTFRNESMEVGAGSVVTRQLLREIQREGTFRISASEAAAVEVQGVVTAADQALDRDGRFYHVRLRESMLTLKAKVSFVDCRNGRVVLDNRVYTAEATYVVGTDRATALQGALERAADDLSRQVTDDLVNFNWKEGDSK